MMKLPCHTCYIEICSRIFQYSTQGGALNQSLNQMLMRLPCNVSTNITPRLQVTNLLRWIWICDDL